MGKNLFFGITLQRVAYFICEKDMSHIAVSDLYLSHSLNVNGLNAQDQSFKYCLFYHFSDGYLTTL